MNSKIKVTLLSTVLAAFALPLVAQTQTPQATPPPQTTTPNQPLSSQSINQRKENQQDRISQGVKSGQLTAGETTNLESKEAGINKQEQNMRSQDNGHLTTADKDKLTREQGNLSNQIYQDKHNSTNRTTDPKSEVGQRQANQQGRIAQGVQSGQLTAGETRNLERNESRINQEVHNDRAANGGKLTQQERLQVNRQQNKMSGQIYKDKHNNRKQ
jgi:hypothetical protein